MVHFTQTGTLHAPASAAHVAMYVNTTAYIEACHAISARTLDHWARSPVDFHCDRLRSMPRTRHAPRKKRQLALLLGSLFGGYLLANLIAPHSDSALIHKVDHVEHKVRDMENSLHNFVNHVDSWAANVTDHIKLIDRRQFIEVQLHWFSAHSWAALQLADSAKKNQLFSPFFSEEELHSIVQSVHTRLQKANFEAPWLNAETFPQLRTSYVECTDGFMLYVHVPIMPTRAPHFRLLKYNMLPLPLTSSTFLEITSSNQFFAVDQAFSLSTELSAADLHSCSRIGDDFFCTDINVFANTLGATCLGAVYSSNVAAAEALCTYHVSKPTLRIDKLNSSSYHLSSSSSEPLTILLRCNGTTSRSSTTAPHTLVINDTCLARVGNFTIDARRTDISAPFHPTTLVWPDEALANSHQFNSSLDEIVGVGAKRMDTNTIAMCSRDRPLSWASYLFRSISSVSLPLVIIFIIVTCLAYAKASKK